jgi:hypothetical protein
MDRREFLNCTGVVAALLLRPPWSPPTDPAAPWCNPVDVLLGLLFCAGVPREWIDDESFDAAREACREHWQGFALTDATLLDNIALCANAAGCIAVWNGRGDGKITLEPEKNLRTF